MPKTITCKKCGCEAPVCSQCPQCASKLNPNQAHLLWHKRRIPALDWMCWNVVARIVLSVALLILALLALSALLTGDAQELERLVLEVMPPMALALAAIGAAVLFVLALRGSETMECVVDNKGVTLRVYQINETRSKLLYRRGRAFTASKWVTQLGVKVDEQTVTWKEITRVQLWSEKGMMLFYSPSWWLRVCLPCDAEMWTEIKAFVREKLGKSKTVSLPRELRDMPKPASSIQAPRANQHPAPFSSATGDDNNL